MKHSGWNCFLVFNLSTNPLHDRPCWSNRSRWQLLYIFHFLASSIFFEREKNKFFFKSNEMKSGLRKNKSGSFVFHKKNCLWLNINVFIYIFSWFGKFVTSWIEDESFLVCQRPKMYANDIFSLLFLEKIIK
jgi:hypothetical protein